MSEARFRLSVLSLPLSLGVMLAECAGQACAAEPPKTDAQGAVNGLKFGIAVRKADAAGRVELATRLENIGKEDVLLWGRACSWGHGRINIDFAGVGQQRARKWREGVGSWRRNVPLAATVKPGDAQEVACNVEEFRLPYGEWDATATYSNDDDGGKLDSLMQRTGGRKVWTGAAKSNSVRLSLAHPPGDVSIALRPTKAEYAVGEAVDLELTVKNGGDKDVTFSATGLRFLSGFALFGPDGGPVELAINPVEINARRDDKTLRHGEEFSAVLKAVNLEKPPGAGYIRHVRYPMPKAGTYFATIKVAGVVSDEAVIRVVGPEGAKKP